MASRDSRGRQQNTMYSGMSQYSSQAKPSAHSKPQNSSFSPSGGPLPGLEALPSSSQRAQLKPSQGAYSKGLYAPSYILTSQNTSPPVFGPNHYFAQSVERGIVDRPDELLFPPSGLYRPSQHGVAYTTHYLERPLERPPIQPQLLTDPVPKPPIDSNIAIDQRVHAFDPDTQKLILTYGGSPLNNRVRVLEKVEDWRSQHNIGPLSVYRKNDAKGGVDHVICNVCRAQPNAKMDGAKDKSRFTSVQKAAEHLTSFHWELPIWQCRESECDRSFRRKQECDRHEESAHGVLAPKKQARLAKNQQNGVQLAPEDMPPTSPKKKSTRTLSTSVRTQRYGRQPSINMSLSADDLSLRLLEQGTVGPTRSRSPSRVRDEPYTPSHSRRSVKRVRSVSALHEADYQPANLVMPLNTAHPQVARSPDMTGSPGHLDQLRTPQIVVTEHGDDSGTIPSRRGVAPASSTFPGTLGHFEPAQSFRYPTPSTSAQYNSSESLSGSTIRGTTQHLPVPNYHNGVADEGRVHFSPGFEEAWLRDFLNGSVN